MRYNELIKESEQVAKQPAPVVEASTQPVPKLEDLWQWSDEFSDEANENARRSALKKIAQIKANNAKAAGERKEQRKNFQVKTLADFGIDGAKFVKEWRLATVAYFKKHPEYAGEWFVDPSIVTPENVVDEAIKKCKVDGEEDPTGFVAIEIFVNPGKKLEAKYGTAYTELLNYWRSILRLTPAAEEKAKTMFVNELKQYL